MSTLIEGRPIHGQRILYVGTGFFEYDRLIVSNLRVMGANVEAIYDRPLPQRLSNSLFSLINPVPAVRKAGQSLHDDWVKKHTLGKHYDCVLCVNGNSLDLSVYDHLRKENPHAKFVLYLWDTITRIKNFADLKTRFDRCLTFDRIDALSDRSLIFRPNFFVPAETTVDAMPQGMIFVGSLHSNRLMQVRSIEAQAAALNTHTRIYLRSGVLKYLKKFIIGDVYGLHWRALPYNKYLEWTQKAEAIIDLPYPFQTGLTQRTLDAVGLGRKIITTNQDIVNYSFYSPENVCVISEENPVIPAGFLNGNSAHYDPRTVQHFTLQQWIIDVLDHEVSFDGKIPAY